MSGTKHIQRAESKPKLNGSPPQWLLFPSWPCKRSYASSYAPAPPLRAPAVAITGAETDRRDRVGAPAAPPPPPRAAPCVDGTARGAAAAAAAVASSSAVAAASRGGSPQCASQT